MLDYPLNYPLCAEAKVRVALGKSRAAGVNAKLGITGGRLVVILPPGQEPTAWKLTYYPF